MGRVLNKFFLGRGQPHLGLLAHPTSPIPAKDGAGAEEYKLKASAPVPHKAAGIGEETKVRLFAKRPR